MRVISALASQKARAPVSSDAYNHQSARLKLDYLAPNQLQKHLTLNETITRLDALIACAVDGADVSDAPAGAVDGTLIITGESPEGDLSAFAPGALLQKDQGLWTQIEAPDGLIVLDRQGGALKVRHQAGWHDAATLIGPLSNLASLGINTTPDALNRFAARLNAALWTAQPAAEGGTGDLRYVLNKESGANTLSLLFQSDWQGRAEIGLIGDDDFTFKVCDDEGQWREAIVIDRSDGRAHFPSGVRGSVQPGLVRGQQPGPVFTLDAGALSLRAGVGLLLDGASHLIETARPVVMPTLSAGEDYEVFFCRDEVLRACPAGQTPAGFSTGEYVCLGGFHHAPGENAPAQDGGTTSAAINPYSIWDLGWRPGGASARGMALVGGRFWADIYLLGTAYLTHGTSAHGQTIADSEALPPIPPMFGGNGTSTYGSFNWWAAAEIMAAHGKRLPTYQEYIQLAFGVREAVSRGNDPVTTGLGTSNTGSSQLDHRFTSRWGMVQAAGVVLTWLADFSFRMDGADYSAAQTFSYKSTGMARGNVLSQASTGLSAQLGGGGWNFGTQSGSRALILSFMPWSQGNNIAARGVCNHWTGV